MIVFCSIFFWPKLKSDISIYIEPCHSCQLTSKPSQSIKPALLCPIPGISQPFEHLVIDCVGLCKNQAACIF